MTHKEGDLGKVLWLENYIQTKKPASIQGALHLSHARRAFNHQIVSKCAWALRKLQLLTNSAANDASGGKSL